MQKELVNKKQIRNNFRNTCLIRDEYSCVLCGKKNVDLDVHHITNRNEMPNGGYVKENGISLCSECHILAENYLNHIEEAEKYNPTFLYQLISSNKELAYQKSLNLK